MARVTGFDSSKRLIDSTRHITDVVLKRCQHVETVFVSEVWASGSTINAIKKLHSLTSTPTGLTVTSGKHSSLLSLMLSAPNHEGLQAQSFPNAHGRSVWNGLWVPRRLRIRIQVSFGPIQRTMQLFSIPRSAHPSSAPVQCNLEILSALSAPTRFTRLGPRH